jgi:DNA-binding transcriptional regulator WhiA
VNGVSHLWQNVETHLHKTVTHLRQFNAWLEQYYSTWFEIALKEALEFAGNNKYDIPLTFKEKRIIRRKRMFDNENSDEPIANPENRLRTEYFNVIANQIKSNIQTQFESFAEFVDKFGFVFEVLNLKKCRKKNC